LRALNDRGVVFQLDALPGRAVRADILVHSRPDLRIMEAVLSGVRHGAASSGGENELLFATTVSGASILRQGARQTRIADGSAVLLRLADGAFTATHPDRVKFLGLRLSGHAIDPFVTNLGDALMRAITPDTPALGLLTSYLRSVAEYRLLEGAEEQQLVTRHVHDLVALLAGASGDAARLASQRGLRAARLRAIQSDIVTHLDSPALTVSAIARRHGVSVRYVHQLFAPTGGTFSEFVLEKRLARAWAQLKDARFDDRTISDVALGVGFGDLSYFNRTFRRRYGCAPRDVRRQDE
jgi:AraC-like DNA-binding protein